MKEIDCNMKYGEIPYVNKKISRIVYGTSTAPFLNGGNAMELLDELYSMGINAFDTGRVYGKAENVLGAWIESRNLQDKVVVQSKCVHPYVVIPRVTPKAMKQDLALSMDALRMNYIDIYLLHRDNRLQPVEPLVETFNEMHATGKIGAFGASNWTYERINQANEYAYKRNLIPFVVTSPSFSLANQIRDPWGNGCLTLSGPQNENARIWYEENHISVISYSSLGRGLLSGKMKSNDVKNIKKYMDFYGRRGYACPDNYERLHRCEVLAKEKNCSVSQIALAWIFHQKLNLFTIVSTTKAFRMKENIEALSIKLSKQECQYLEGIK